MTKAVLAQITGALRAAGRVGPSDAELLDLFRRSRDEEAFAALVRRHGTTVLAACRHVLTDPADVDDAFQATFVFLLKKIAAVEAATIGSWLYAVAHRVAVRTRSDARRRAAREHAAAARRPTPLAPDPSWREAVAVLHEELDGRLAPVPPVGAIANVGEGRSHRVPGGYRIVACAAGESGAAAL